MESAVVASGGLCAENLGFGAGAVIAVAFAQMRPDEEWAWVGWVSELGDDAIDFEVRGVVVAFMKGVGVSVDDFEAFEGAVLLGERAGIGDDGDGSVAGGLEVGGDGVLFGCKAGAPGGAWGCGDEGWIHAGEDATKALSGGGGGCVCGFKKSAFFGDFGELWGGVAFVAGHGGVIPAEGVDGDQDDVGGVFWGRVDLCSRDGLDVGITGGCAAQFRVDW